MSYGIGSVCSLLPANSIAVQDELITVLSRAADNWDYRQRSPMNTPHRSLWVGLWSAPSSLYGDPGLPLSLLGQGNADHSERGEWALGDGGHRNPYRINGTVTASDGGGVSGAQIRAFRVSDNAFISSAVSNANGTYSVPVPSNTDTYYLHVVNTGPGTVGGTIDGITAT